MFHANPPHTRAYYEAARTLDRLCRAVNPDRHCVKLPAPDPERPWAPGAEWGQSRRVRPINGIHWEMECECGQRFVISTNDSTPDSKRKCQVCRERDELALAAERLNQLATALSSGELVALTGRFVQAQKLWEKYRKYVHARVWAEIRPYVGGKEYGLFDDVEHAVWERVANKVEDFRGFADGAVKTEQTTETLRRATMAWLKSVVRATVTDHFRFEYRKKQDQRRTVSIPGDDSREMAVLDINLGGCLNAKATANADYLNGLDEDEGGAIIEHKAACDSAISREWRAARIN